MKKLYCSELDESTEREITESTFVIDGYAVGDRLLEGVIFHVHFEDETILSVKVDEKHKNYFSKFNEKMFLDKVRNYAERIIEEGDMVDVSDSIRKKYNFTDETEAYIK